MNCPYDDIDSSFQKPSNFDDADSGSSDRFADEILLMRPKNRLAMNLVGCSAAFQKVLSMINHSACCDAPVLIGGETGTGKEMAARAIHYSGTGQDYPFIPLNCGAIPDHLIENELFGHEKGAYTDARQSQLGLIIQAEGGTLFLDEIETLSVKGQVTLLRFIEDQVVRPLGAKQTKTVNVRIIAASNTSLSALVDKAQFRQDLLFRLNLIFICLTPLRERSQDIQHLAEFFMQKYREKYGQPDKRIDPEILNRMHDYAWPGNIRELENFIHRAFLLPGDSWSSQMDIEQYRGPADGHAMHSESKPNLNFDGPFNEAKTRVINDFEKRYLTRLISSTNGNVTKAAGIAKKERRAFGKLLKKHKIDPGNFRGF